MHRPPDDSAARFLSLASHELRGPLGTVRTYAALLASPRFALEERQPSGVAVTATIPFRTAAPARA